MPLLTTLINDQDNLCIGLELNNKNGQISYKYIMNNNKNVKKIVL